jgi:hypothetical protein
VSDDFKTLLRAARLLYSGGDADVADAVMAVLCSNWVPDDWRGTSRIGELYSYMENWDAPLPACVEGAGDQRPN